MKTLALTILLLLAACAKPTPRIPFNQGPPRMTCKADIVFAQVGKPWLWSCTVAGDLAPFAQTLIGVEVITKNREEWPARSIVGEGLKRVYPYASTFDEEYYLELIGHVKIGPDDRNVEIIRPDDPTYPMEPIEGLEASLDGSFWLRVTLYEVLSIDPATRQIEVKSLTSGRVNGRLQCPMCAA